MSGIPISLPDLATKQQTVDLLGGAGSDLGRTCLGEKNSFIRGISPDWLEERYKQVEKLYPEFLLMCRAASLEKHTGI